MLLTTSLSPNEEYAQGEHSYFGLRERKNLWTNKCEIALTHGTYNVEFNGTVGSYVGQYYIQGQDGRFQEVVIEREFKQEYPDVWFSDVSLIHFAERGFSESYFEFCKNEWYREGHVLPAPYDTLTMPELSILKYHEYVGTGCQNGVQSVFAYLSATEVRIVFEKRAPIQGYKIHDNYWTLRVEIYNFSGEKIGESLYEIGFNDMGFVTQETRRATYGSGVCRTEWNRVLP
jgi:hypothetical protein